MAYPGLPILDFTHSWPVGSKIRKAVSSVL